MDMVLQKNADYKHEVVWCIEPFQPKVGAPLLRMIIFERFRNTELWSVVDIAERSNREALRSWRRRQWPYAVKRPKE